MFRDSMKNWDERPLEADHSVSRSQGGKIADRLLHSVCNRSRQDGARDHLRPAVTGIADVGAKVDDRSRWCLLDW